MTESEQGTKDQMPVAASDRSPESLPCGMVKVFPSQNQFVNTGEGAVCSNMRTSVCSYKEYEDPGKQHNQSSKELTS